MTFTYPLVLFLLVIPMGLLIWVWRRRGQRVVMPFDHARAGTGWGWKGLLNVAESLPPLLLAVVIVLLAGPLRYSQPQTKRALTNIELCVDVSGSMGVPFAGGTRYDTSMQAIDEFLTYRKGDAFGLTFFGHNVLHWVPLTTDVSAIRCAPPFMRPDAAPPWMGGTMIGLALRSCMKVLESRQEGDRMIVLISDGGSFDMGDGTEIAKELRESNVVVYHIHIGDDQLPDAIATVTSMTGGEVFNPGDEEGLRTVFRRIDQMQQAKLKKTLAESLDDFAPYCVAALSLLSLFSLTLLGIRYTPW